MLAVLVGYLALIILEVIGGAFLAAALRGHGGATLIVGGEVVTFVAGVMAGAITARMAPTRPLTHATVLGLTVITVTSIVAAISQPPAGTTFPHWYPYAAALLGGAGAFVGGALANRDPQAS